jgi:hypothetical protein
MEQTPSKDMPKWKQKANKITTGDVHHIVTKHHDDSQTSSTGMQRKLLESIRRAAKCVLLTKDLSIGLSRLDPHRITPVVLGGVYCTATIIDGNIDARKSAFPLCLNILNTLALWKFVEQCQIVPNLDKDVDKEYEQLKEELVKMYEDVIVLLGTLTAYFDSKRHEYTHSLHFTLHSD